MKKLLLTAVVFLLSFFALYHPASIAYPVALDTPVREVNVDGRYSMMVPNYLTEADDLNDEASLQYENIYKEVYIIVIDESKQEFVDVFKEKNDYDTAKTVLENYARAQMADILSNMSKVTKQSALKKVQTRSGEAMVYDVSGYQEGIDAAMGFKVGFIEGRLNLYMIMTWTFDRTFAVYEDDMTNMIKSFKELSGEIEGSVEAGTADIVRPEYMLPVTPQNNAFLQYEGAEQQLYVALFKESSMYWDSLYAARKVENMSLLEFFASEKKKEFESVLVAEREVSGFSSARVNGLETESFSMYAKPTSADKEMYYKFRFVKGNEAMYIIKAWTPTKKQSANQDAINSMLSSFSEI